MKKHLILVVGSVFFLASAIGWDIYQRNQFSDESFALQVSSNLAVECANLKKESQFIFQDTSERQWTSLSYPFFLIEDGRIIKWNSSSISLTAQDLFGDFEWKLIQA